MDRQELLNRAIAADFPVEYANGTHLTSERLWRNAIDEANHRGLELLESALEPHEARLARRREYQAAWAQTEAIRNEPPSDEEIAERERERAELQRQIDYRASTEGRLESIEGVLAEIRDLLSKGR